MKKWQIGLNDKQIEAVTHGQKPLLILAGAGSGKTRVITSRIAWLIAEKNFRPYSILAVTFTNKAANEMRERATELHPFARDSMIKTFHSFGAWLLRRYADLIGIPPNFTIYDIDDQAELLGQIVPSANKSMLREWVRRISRAKDGGLAPDDDLYDISKDPQFPEIYTKYEQHLRKIGNVDFGDLILLPYKLLNQNPNLKSRLHHQFKAILVDEYQDTNVAQFLLLRELVGKDTWMCVVGDDDQSIYGFRGAELGNILNFKDVFNNTAVIKLEQNYRSTDTILKIASAVVKNNHGRLGKTLWTDKVGGDKAVLIHLEDNREEAMWCAQSILDAGNYSQTAVLYRTNAQSQIFETTFREHNIPYILVGALSFYKREEIKDCMAYLSWIANRRDIVAFMRAANKPARGIGSTSMKTLLEHAAVNHEADILEACSTVVLKGKAAKAVLFLAALHRQFNMQNEPDAYDNLGELIKDLLEKSGLIEHYRQIAQADESLQKLENLEVLVNIATIYPASFDGLTNFLETTGLDDNLANHQDEYNPDRVTLITVHKTKGLEYDHVYITGLEDGLFPKIIQEYTEPEDIEEERRLFYVAVTRARQTLGLSYCRSRMIWGQFKNSYPSRFLQEIPPDTLEVQDGGYFPSFSPEPQDDWVPGVQVYHDDYGVGTIQKRLSNSGHTAIHVLFESGRRATLLPEFSTNKLEVLGKT